jgi:hypothetical protein
MAIPGLLVVHGDKPTIFVDQSLVLEIDQQSGKGLPGQAQFLGHGIDRTQINSFK